MRGADLAWNLERYLAVFSAAREAHIPHREHAIQCLVDANEQCPAPEYMVEFLWRLREASPDAFASLRYVEQPTTRDLRHDRFDMRALAALKPVVADESLTSLAALDEAVALGWSGVALKTCKCHSLALLCAARAEREGLTYMVQDLSNPGIALLHSVGLAAHIRPALPMEANARQYYPHTSSPEAAVHPEIFGVRDGAVALLSLGAMGLGYRVGAVGRPLFVGARECAAPVRSPDAARRGSCGEQRTVAVLGSGAASAVL